jgi:hypothetical protein
MNSRRLIRSFRRSVKSKYWTVVEKVNRPAYLRHAVDSDFESDDFDTELYEEWRVIDTRIWIKRGTKVHLAISDVPRTDKESPWQESDYGNYVDWDTLRKFKKLKTPSMNGTGEDVNGSRP